MRMRPGIEPGKTEEDEGRAGGGGGGGRMRGGGEREDEEADEEEAEADLERMYMGYVLFIDRHHTSFCISILFPVDLSYSFANYCKKKKNVLNSRHLLKPNLNLISLLRTLEKLNQRTSAPKDTFLSFTSL